jgi:hypothetical protein
MLCLRYRVVAANPLLSEGNRRMSMVQVKPISARSVLAGINFKLIAFTLLAGLFGLASLFVMEGLTEGLLPWVTLGCPGCPDGVEWHIEQQRWHGAEHGALLGLLFGGSLFALLWRARQKPLVLQFYLLGHVALVLGYLAFRPVATPVEGIVAFVIMVGVTSALLIVTYPERRHLFELKAGAAVSRRLLGVTAASALVLIPVAFQNLQRQLSGFGGEHASEARWAGALIMIVCLLLAGVLSSTRRPGWQTLGTIVGITYLYLGAAALSVPDQFGSWGVAGGAAAIVAGIAYLVATITEARRASTVRIG